ncbi:YHYH protein [Arcticibacterium luteifluviistationis]|uniref:YHYH protein n=1 Tax=Arcticibacterium luteifluviistationis TaxID=1784714 RepID=A0A2Z4G866_9BACT|nr:YHYH protein [Arcticibacterium luteifluviistationis]AWV97300.1 YHYH protein [Arcticibacterium luteifluviistationis]
MKTYLFKAIALLAITLSACTNNTNNTKAIAEDKVTVAVKSENFLSGGLAEPITIEKRELSDGSTADCYKIVVTSTPTDHEMGPWCPGNIADDASAGGIWLEGGEVYDVDGEFVKNLATFYKDDTWMLYNSATGEITKTKTKEECQEAANPNVGVEYQNYCVECLPSYVADVKHTYYIPVTPKKAATPYIFASRPGGGGGPPKGERPPRPEGAPEGERPQGPPRGNSTLPSSRGIAFNGVVFDAPAPTDAILGAYTLAPFDDAGGHINLAAGYHYHAATGVSKKLAQADNHAAMIGYAFDGYGIFENTDSNGKEYTDLDKSRGHYDEVRGYHYHVDQAGNNNFINGLRGEYAL